jgi:pimeloyl-ACP methyl ester carboxylesterase
MPVFEHASVTLHYERSGNGPPLLLIAGMMSDSASWAPLIPLLEPHFDLIRPDNRTTGRTVPWQTPAGVDDVADDCHALLSHLGTGPAHVMGHSLGGMIGMRLATRHPDAVRTLTLAAAAPLRLERNVALFKTLLAIRQSDAAPEVWLRALFPWLFSPAFFETQGAVDQAVMASLAYPYAQSPAAMAQQISGLEGYQPDTISDLICPFQAILGREDLLMPTPLAQSALGAVPIHVIAGAGHSIHWDAPDAVAAHLSQFIAQHEETLS